MTQEQELNDGFLPRRDREEESWAGVSKVEKVVFCLADQIIPFVETRRELNQAVDMLRLMLRRRLQKKQRANAMKKAVEAGLARRDKKTAGGEAAGSAGGEV